MNLSMQKYYNKIVKKENDSFLNAFDQEWNIFLENLDLEYTSSKQLQIGNRLRPIMVCWGYMHCHNINEKIDFHYIAQIVVSLEAMHKASVIIDDVIDGDSKRRGVDCMHIEYSEYEAIFFSVCMISSAISSLNQKLHSNILNTTATATTSLLCNTIYKMCKGALLEITSTESDRLNLNRIKEIIDLETSTLLENSLIIGYIASSRTNEKMQNILESIGVRCGYIFQVMNDLEPFCNPEYIQNHKGNLNSDCFKSRKNVVIPYLIDNLKRSEKNWLKKALNEPGKFLEIKALFEKYDMKKKILDEVYQIRNYIYKDIQLLNDFSNNENWISCFKSFVDYLINYCLSILNGVPQNWE